MQKRKLIFFPLFGIVIYFCFGFTAPSKPDFNDLIYYNGTPGDTVKSGIRIPKTNWANTMGCTYSDTMCVSLWTDNTLHAKLIVQVTDPNIGNYPDMHFFYAFQGQATPATIGYTGPVTSVVPTVFEDGTHGWEAAFPFVFDMDYVCDHIFNDLHQKHFFFQVEYILVTPIDTGYTIYPVGDYPDLFSPDVFYISHTGYAESSFVKKEICCYDETYVCSDSADVPYNNIRISNDEVRQNKRVDVFVEPDDSNQDDFNAVVFPNPFSSDVNIKIKQSVPESGLSLTVYDLYGKVVMLKDDFDQSMGNNEFELSTMNWSSGVYYFQFSTAEETSVIKMIKQ